MAIFRATGPQTLFSYVPDRVTPAALFAGIASSVPPASTPAALAVPMAIAAAGVAVVPAIVAIDRRPVAVDPTVDAGPPWGEVPEADPWNIPGAVGARGLGLGRRRRRGV